MFSFKHPRHKACKYLSPSFKKMPGHSQVYMLYSVQTTVVHDFWFLFHYWLSGNNNSYYCLPYNSHDVSFESSHHSTAWYCIDIVRRNSLLVTHRS